MKYLIALVLAFTIVGGSALADVQTPFVVPNKVCLITTAVATVCANLSTNIVVNGVMTTANVVGVVNNSLAAQTATVTCYDNASAASGTVVVSIPPLAAGASILFPPVGRPLVNGLTCLASASPSGAIEVYTHN